MTSKGAVYVFEKDAEGNWIEKASKLVPGFRLPKATIMAEHLLFLTASLMPHALSRGEA